ncbi:unnamed protein product [Prunus armeniaca]
MGALKSPGPDGFSGIFYQKYWSIIGEDMCGLVKRFLSENENISTMNVIEIALVPKVLSPELVTQFCPIALCNYSYKVISKILANNLQPHLNAIISPQQCAFIPGRQVQDNIFIAHEAFHSLKLDINKAYDRIEWSRQCY